MEEFLLKLGFVKDPSGHCEYYSKTIRFNDSVELEILVSPHGRSRNKVEFYVNARGYKNVNLMHNYFQITKDIEGEIMQKYVAMAPLLGMSASSTINAQSNALAEFYSIDSDIIIKEFEHFDEMIEKIKEVTFELLKYAPKRS